MASIVHKADGRICVKWKKDGKWVFQYLGRGPSAQLLAERIKYDHDQAEACPAPPGVTFDELVAMYLQSRVRMSAKNLDALIYRFKSVISPLLGSLDASQVNHAALNKYILTRREQSRTSTDSRTGHVITYPPPSPVTVQNEIACILAVLNFAAYKTQPPLLSDNPAKGFQKGKILCAVIEPPSEAEIAAILHHAVPHLFRAIVLGLMCGARPGESELFRITWDHVDFEGDKLTIISAKKGGIEKRDIPLSRSLREHLVQWREEDAKTGDSYLIHYRGRPVSKVQKAFSTAKRRAGITRELRLYDLRHYFISKMLEGRADLKSVSLMAGHADETMVLRKYQHITSAMKREAINTLPDIPLAPLAPLAPRETKK